MQLTIGAWRLSVEREQPKQAELESIYDQTSWYWDSPLHQFVCGRAYLRFFRQLVKKGELNFPKNPVCVLDCGIGAGLFSEALVTAVSDNDFEIFGIDLSQKLLAKASEHLLRHNVKINLKHGNFYPLPFSEGKMDLVISALTLEHSPNPAEMIRKMTRVLRPGGAIILVTTHTLAPDFLMRLFYRYRPLKSKQVIDWMNNAQLSEIRSYPLSGLARLFGQAFAGRKI